MTIDMDAPVFSLKRHREMVRNAVERAKQEEREKITAALLIQANTLGGVIGAALREIATQVADSAPIGTGVANVVERRERSMSEHAAEPYDAAYDYAIEFAALTEPERQRRLRRLAEESQAAHEKLARDQRADEERIARDKEARQARGETADDSIVEHDASLPVDRERDDMDVAKSILGRRLPTPPTLDEIVDPG